MAATLDPAASTLLDLLLEAADEPVTLGELEVVGVIDPARALLELERAGHGLIRVYDRTTADREVACVRLARPGEPAPPSAPAPEPVTAAPRASPPARRVESRPWLGALLAALLLLVLGTAARRVRRG